MYGASSPIQGMPQLLDAASWQVMSVYHPARAVRLLTPSSQRRLRTKHSLLTDLIWVARPGRQAGVHTALAAHSLRADALHAA